MNKTTVQAGLGVLLVYLGYHALAGEQGLASWRELQVEVDTLEQERDALLARRDALSRDVERLLPGSLDLDLVEELARTKLHYAYPDDLVIALPDQTPDRSTS